MHYKGKLTGRNTAELLELAMARTGKSGQHHTHTTYTVGCHMSHTYIQLASQVLTTAAVDQRR